MLGLDDRAICWFSVECGIRPWCLVTVILILQSSHHGLLTCWIGASGLRVRLPLADSRTDPKKVRGVQSFLIHALWLKINLRVGASTES